MSVRGTQNSVGAVPPVHPTRGGLRLAEKVKRRVRRRARAAAALEYAITRTVDANAAHRNFAGQYIAPHEDVINFDLRSTAGSRE